ncbi:MAG: histidine--tRNA ligase [Bacteroidales bacterium]|nr:histidine--tRNA ligase [Bacteroidales bacterium]
MAQKPSIPKGTRDFSPIEMARRNYIFDTIRDVFRLYGYRQIETPAMENLSTLMGKYGEEGDKLLFKILNSGDYMKDVDMTMLQNGDLNRVAAQLCEKGLRYDLTVPFARYVVQHRNEITFPFKRFQIQPVWRADRPQKGRYREFYQCDADVVGSDSLVNEIELLSMIDEVFRRLKINIEIKLNNRKVLAGIAEYIGAPEKIIDITVAIDKIDKIGLDAVKEELTERGLSAEAVEKLTPVLLIDGSTEQRIEKLAEIIGNTESGRLGIDELKTVFDGVKKAGIEARITLDVSLARGLNYYTGTIIEVKALDVEIGSITGGGRYDNLTGIFGLKDVSGVGISFGADRIYDVLNTLDLYPENTLSAVEVMFTNMGENEASVSMKMLREIRRADIAAEIYPDVSKMQKQMKYADTLGVKYVAIVGETEAANGTLTLKNMATGDQQTVTPDEAIAIIKA